jgi:HTH-type transcriptional regulator / antitoxin HigA
MILSEADYSDAVARSDKSAERLAAYRGELRAQGLANEEIERAVALAISLHDQLKDEIGQYERIKEGDLSGFKTLRDVGPLLIAARLARGFSQRDLAEILDVQEAQLSRYEMDEYQGISLERAAQILELLSVDVEIRGRVCPVEGKEGIWVVGRIEPGDPGSMSNSASFAQEKSGGRTGHLG